VLVLFWAPVRIVVRALVMAVAVAVEVFATLQLRAARRGGGSLQIA
jgi:hypothetical protein